MIDKFEMFIALARERHFGRAAESCGVSQPTLSAALRSLEDSYGVPLVLRGSRFKGLTPEGEKLLVRARNIMAEANAIRSDLQQMSTDLDGVLRLGVIPTALTAVPQIAGPLLRAHPRVRLDIRSLSSHDIMDALSDVRIDAAISYAMDDDGRAHGHGIDSWPLYAESWGLVTPADRAPPAAAWEDLPRMRLCLLSPNMQNRRTLDRILAARGLSVDPVVISSSILALTAQLLAGSVEGLVLPIHPARIAGRMPGMTCLPLPAATGEAGPQVALLAPPEGKRGQLVSEFLRLATEQA